VKIRRIKLDEVCVPARPDSINSPGIDQPLHKLSQGAKRGWTQQFDAISKTIIRLELENGTVGLGETYRGIPNLLLQELASSLIGQRIDLFNLQDLPLPTGRAYDGFECALTDASAKVAGVPLYRFLGGKYRDRVPCAYWTGHRTTSDAIRKSQEAVTQGYSRITFKCNLQDPVVDWCEAIQSSCGKTISVILDPNERFELAAHTEKIAHCLARIGNVLYLEDPIPRWDMETWHHLRGKISVPLSMHISLPYLEMGQTIRDLARAVRREASDYFNFNGGIYAFVRMASLADLFGIPCSHGSEIDLGILEASYVHKAASVANARLPSDIFGRLIREHDLLQEPLRFHAGHVQVPEEPGLGVHVSEDALQHYLREHWEVEG
jgi:muconate cycloisomerase